MKVIMNKDKMERTIKRLSHEIIEHNSDLTKVVLLGIKSKGVPFAKLLQTNIENFEGLSIDTRELDITKYRDDIETRGTEEKIDMSLEGKTVILVDDVLYTGRTIRAAMDAVMDIDRPEKIQLAVLVDRGHRELPISPNYIGKNYPTSKSETVVVSYDNENSIVLK